MSKEIHATKQMLKSTLQMLKSTLQVYYMQYYMRNFMNESYNVWAWTKFIYFLTEAWTKIYGLRFWTSIILYQHTKCKCNQSMILISSCDSKSSICKSADSLKARFVLNCCSIISQDSDETFYCHQMNLPSFLLKYTYELLHNWNGLEESTL
jgi:hypothetical protein